MPKKSTNNGTETWEDPQPVNTERRRKLWIKVLEKDFRAIARTLGFAYIEPTLSSNSFQILEAGADKAVVVDRYRALLESLQITHDKAVV